MALLEFHGAVRACAYQKMSLTLCVCGEDGRGEENQMESAARLLPGYMAVSSDGARRGVAGPFLMRVGRLHQEMGTPFTLFVRAGLLTQYNADLQRVRELCGEGVDFQLCTDDDVALKTVCQENHRGVTVVPAAAMEVCCDRIARASDLMERLLGVRPMGLASSLGYYRGLSDRPDVLAHLQRLGMRFLRTYTRNARDWAPVTFEVQPFFYTPQGFDDVLEIPGQGGMAIEECEEFARRDAEDYVRRVRKDLDYVAAKKLTFSFVQRDWCAIHEDAEMACTRAILEYARNAGMLTMSHRACFEQMRAARQEKRQAEHSPDAGISPTTN